MPNPLTVPGAAVLVLSIAVSARALGLAEAKTPTPTVADVFDKYCALEQASEWFCAEPRKLRLPASQKWEIVEAYCFDEPGVPRPAEDEIRKHIEALQATAATRVRGELCQAHRATPVPLALEFNHRDNKWSASNKGFESQRRGIEIDPVSGAASAHLASGDHVGIIVTRTNPVLFVVNRGEPKEDNIDQIKSLERLLELLGGSLATLARDAAQTSINTDAALSSLRTAKVAIQTKQGTKGRSELLGHRVGVDLERLSDDVLAALVDNVIAERVSFNKDLGQLRKWIDAARISITPVQTKLTRLKDHRKRIQELAQELEKGPATLKGALDENLESPGMWTGLFKVLATEEGEIPSLQGCDLLFEAFPAVVVTSPDSAVDVHGAAIRFRHLLGAPPLKDGKEIPPCKELEYASVMNGAVQEIADAAQRAARNPSDAALARALRETQGDGRERYLENAMILGRLVRQLAAAKQNLKDTVSKEEDTRKAAIVLGIVASRVRDAGIRRTAEGDLLVTNRIFVEDELYSSRFTKVRTTPIKISLNSPYADAVPTDRPKETTTSYRLVRRGLDRLTFGVGLVYTRAYGATYVAADLDPSMNETRTTTTTTGGPPPAPVDVTQISRPELKHIVEKERQPRGGSYAVLVNWRAYRHRALGCGGQFGVATSTDNPAFLGGVSFNFSSYVTVGVGYGMFRVKWLHEDQQGPDVRVASTDEIRTEPRWKGAPYLSLSFNLSGLPLFK